MTFFLINLTFCIGNETEDDEAKKAQSEYLKSLKKWIEENAKDQQEAWQMFWDAYKQQQESLGNWTDDQAEHHQQMAYWWFQQAFDSNEDKENDEGTNSETPVKMEPQKTKTEAYEYEQNQLQSQQNIKIKRQADDEPSPPKRVKQEAGLKSSENDKFKSKLANLSSLLRDVRKQKQAEKESAVVEPENERNYPGRMDSERVEKVQAQVQPQNSLPNPASLPQMLQKVINFTTFLTAK